MQLLALAKYTKLAKMQLLACYNCQDPVFNDSREHKNVNVVKTHSKQRALGALCGSMTAEHATGGAVVQRKDTAADVGVMRPAVKETLLCVHENVREEKELSLV